MLSAYDAQLRMWVPPSPSPGYAYERIGATLRVTGQARGFVETAVDVGARGDALDALIAEHRDWFAGRGEAMEWKTRGHDRPADLTSRLRAAGYVAEPPETVMVAPVGAIAAEPELPAGVALRAADTAAAFAGIGALQTAVWGADGGRAVGDLQARAAHEQLVVLLAEAGGEVVCAAWVELMPGTDFAGLWGGTTLPAWRRRGIYRALVARRALLAQAAGARYLHVDASDDSRPILARLGFEAIATTTPYVWSPV